jgi:hypothetical protein
MWHIERPDMPREHGHASEGSLDNYDGFDRFITNDGTIDDLISKLREIPV